MAGPELRCEPAALDAAWFTTVLQHLGHDVVVDEVQSKAIGTGQSAHSERFTLHYRRWDQRAPRGLVAKLPAPDPTSRATGHNHGAYGREITFYRDLRSTLRIPTPACYYLDFNPSNSDFVLLLEDLAPAQQGNQMAGCSWAEAQAAVTTLAGLHGPRWNDPTLLDQPIFAASEAASGAARLPFQMFWGEFVKRYEDRLAPAIRALGEAFCEHYGNWATQYPGPRTVIHGDYRLDNLLIGGTADQPTIHAVDWQTVNIGCAAHDVAYFIGAGLLPDARRLHEQQLVAAWHQALGEFGVAAYSLEQAWQDYRWYSFAGYVMAVIASILVVRTPRGDEMFMVMAHRHGQQALDLGALELIAAGR